MYTTRMSQWMPTSPAPVYAVLLDPEAVARWRVPAGMSAEVHTFEAREGGRFRVSLSYSAPGGPEGPPAAPTPTTVASRS